MSEAISKETADMITAFRDARDWRQFHNPKDLAISISLEAAELLEVFQWSGENVSADGKLEKIKEELADVVNYCILMADACDINLDEAIRNKIQLNAKKYPAEKVKGSSAKYTAYEGEQ